MHSLHANNFPIDDPDFQHDLALAFKFIHASISKQYGIDSPFYKAIDKFKKESDLIIANRIDGVIEDVKEKVFSRDIFNKD